jgi:SnoaL-like domain
MGTSSQGMCSPRTAGNAAGPCGLRQMRTVPRACRLIAVVLLLVAAGCRPQPKMSRQDRWARAWIDSLNSHNLRQVASLLVKGATYEDPLSGGERSGPSLAFLLVNTFNRHPQAHYELGHITADKDRLAVEWKATGLRRSTQQPPLSGVFVIQLRGDAIASVRGYFDARGLR